jgi:transposase-like protein
MGKTRQFTIEDFRKHYPDDDACLQKIFDLRYGEIPACPGCGVVSPKYTRVKTRKYFHCTLCLYQISPTAGTIFHKSSTPLSLWFHVIFLFASSKNGVSGKEIERQLGVTYKCAWRIGHKIRELMDEKDILMEGIVEVDESLYGGRTKGGKRGWGAKRKACIFGMIERGGKVITTTIPKRSKEIILPIIGGAIIVGTLICTDEFKAYRHLTGMGYQHGTVNHSKYEWRRGIVYTNTMEGFWSNLKKSLAGTHTQVSAKYLQNYLNEFNFRHNRRKGVVMFDAILNQVI